MRYERKYRIENVALGPILQQLRLHPAGLRPIYQQRQVNNIYFDTPDFVTYKDNVKGVPHRRKYRVRWYGDSIRHVEDPVFEVKIKHMELGKKEQLALQRFHLSNLGTLVRQVNAKCPEGHHSLRPVLLNSYQRLYFSTSDEQFRITVDWQLRYSPLLHAGFFNKHHYQEENCCIVEIKYDESLDADADRITQHLGFRRTKNSKYVSGVELCYW